MIQCQEKAVDVEFQMRLAWFQKQKMPRTFFCYSLHICQASHANLE